MPRLPVTAEARPPAEAVSPQAKLWARIERRLPASLRRELALGRRLPRPSGKQIFAVAVPVGLLLGWFASYAVDPDIMQSGGKPYSEVGANGVQVKLAQSGEPYDTLPEDPAPLGYGPPHPAYLNAGIAEAGDYADSAEKKAGEPVPGAIAAGQIADGQVLGEDPAAAAKTAAARTPATPAIKVVPQDAPL